MVAEMVIAIADGYIECHSTIELTKVLLYVRIAVGTGTWGIAAVIPKYLSLRL